MFSSERGKLDPSEQHRRPLFPWMDVNDDDDKDQDASKVPKPPPRNKMALSLAPLPLPAAHSYNITCNNVLPPPSASSNYAVSAPPPRPLMMPLFIPPASSVSFFQQVMSPLEAMTFIGQDAFHTLRKEMTQHQILFVHQLMELHRVIMVQRHLAQYMHQQLKKASSSRMLNPIKETQKGQMIVQRGYNNIVSRPKPSSEGLTGMFNLPQQQKDPFKVPLPIAPRVNQETNAGMHAIAGGLNLPWIPPQPVTGNQWLQPLVLPSEGLVYKPYPITPVPNPAGLILSQTINPPKAMQTHHPSSQQSGTRPFADAPYRGTPLLNVLPSVSSSHPASALLRSGSAFNPIPSHALQPSSIKSLWNPSNFASGSITSKIDVPRQTRHIGDSMASSSPAGAAQGHTLSLFPEEPTNMALQNKHHQHPPEGS